MSQPAPFGPTPSPFPVPPAGQLGGPPLQSPEVGRLGCGSYQVWLCARGGTPLLEIPATRLSWERVLDDTSQASVQAVNCGRDLAFIRTWQHEIAVFRNGGRVWSGPITDVRYPPPRGLQITARDLSAWWDKRFLHSDHVFSDGTDLSMIFTTFADDAMSPENQPRIVVLASPCGIVTSMTTQRSQQLIAGSQIRDLANNGIDWTVVDREVLVGGITIPASPLGLLTDDWFDTPLTPHDDGSTKINSWVVSGSGGGAAGDALAAAALSQEDIDRDGLLESVDTVSSIQDHAGVTAAVNTRLLLTKDAIVLEDGHLALNAPVEIAQLIAGAVAQLALRDTTFPVDGDWRLKSVSVAVEPGKEDVTVVFQPPGQGPISLFGGIGQPL